MSPFDAESTAGAREELDSTCERYCKRLYQSRQWFALRDAVARNPTLPFYQDAVDCVFHRIQKRNTWFAAILRSATHSWETYEAHRLLSWAHMRKAEFRMALVHLEAMAGHRQGRDAPEAGRRLVAYLASFPEQSVERCAPSMLSYTIVDGNLFVPAAINGVHADCMMDSGAGLCFISESEAGRLGIEIQEPGPQGLPMYTATGDQTSYRIAIARQLEVGKFRILNVVFLVLKNHQFQFPPGCQTALGLPILLALRTVGWRADATLAIGAPRGKKGLSDANLCFDSGDLALELAVHGKKVIFLLDTGCGATVFWPPFAKHFAQMVKRFGAAGSTQLHGVGGVAEVSNITLPAVELEIAGRAFTLRHAPILTEPTTPNSRWLCGRLGIDLLNQAGSVLLDFGAMELSF